MTANPFDRLAESAVFKDESVLEENYRPTEIVGRDDEITELTENLREVFNGSTPKNLFINGPNGTGKTVLADYILDRLKSHPESAVDLHTKHIQCIHTQDGYHLAIKAVNQFRENPENCLHPGLDADIVYDHLWDELDSIGDESSDTPTTIIFVLDELGTVDDISNFVYSISRARKAGFVENVNVGFIATSDDATAFDANALESRTASSLKLRSMSLSPYDANQLRTVLYQRVGTAFRNTTVVNDATGRSLRDEADFKEDNSYSIESDVLDEGVIPVAASLGARNHGGDARKALDLLLESGHIAEMDGNGVVTEDHVYRAEEKLERDELAGLLKELDGTKQVVSYALATLLAEEQTPRTRLVYERYESLVTQQGYDAVSERRVRDVLNELSTHGLTTKQNITSDRGQYDVHGLDGYSVNRTLSALSSVIDFYGVHTSVADFESVQND
jgi:cell division control protein 6